MTTVDKGKLAAWVRTLTRRSPRLYAWLSQRDHAHTIRQEHRWLKKHAPDTLLVLWTPAELQALRDAGHESQFGQERCLLDQQWIPQHGGRFLDIGCNHPVTCSNSFFLERHCGYRGMAIDALEQFEADWAEHRPNTKFIQAFLSDSTEPVPFTTVDGPQGWEHMLSGHQDSVDLAGKDVSTRTHHLSPEPLPRILSQAGFDFGVDVLFMDVEGHELNILKTADWTGPTPRVVVCENTGPMGRQAPLRAFMDDHGYRFAARVSLFDDVFLSRQAH